MKKKKWCLINECRVVKCLNIQKFKGWSFISTPKMHRLIKSKEEQKQDYAETRERETKKKKQNQKTKPRTRQSA